MKMQVTVELDVEIDREEYPELDEKDVLDGVYIYDDYLVDGFVLSTDIPNCNNLHDFFLRSGKIIKKEMMPENPDIIVENEERMEITL